MIEIPENLTMAHDGLPAIICRAPDEGRSKKYRGLISPLVAYKLLAMIVKATDEYEKAVKSIRDRRAVIKISIRIHRLANGNAGDARSVGDGVSELRIDHGPGYRIYYTQIGAEILLLLTCGDKSTQDKDIATAKRLKNQYE